MNELNNKPFFSVTELAESLGITRQAVHKRIKSGKIRAETIGHAFVIPKEEVERLLGKKLEGLDREDAIRKAVEKTIHEYGETLKRLGGE
jgi:excisionase family DNA binding protein